MELLHKSVVKTNLHSALHFLSHMTGLDSVAEKAEINSFPQTISRFSHRDVAPLGTTALNGERKDYAELMEAVRSYDQDAARLAERHGVLAKNGMMLHEGFLSEGNKIEILKIASCYFMEENVHFDAEGNMEIVSPMGKLVFNAQDAALNH